MMYPNLTLTLNLGTRNIESKAANSKPTSHTHFVHQKQGTSPFPTGKCCEAVKERDYIVYR